MKRVVWGIASAVVTVLLCATTAFAGTSYSDWKYLGYRTSPEYAEFWGRTFIYTSSSSVYAAAVVYSGHYDSVENWVSVGQVAGMMRAQAALYKNGTMKGRSAWSFSQPDGNDHASAWVNDHGDTGDYYWAEGWGQYYYLGDYVPVPCDLYGSPIRPYSTRSLYSLDGTKYKETVAYLHSCGITELKYGVTSNGETYGSALLEDVLGEAPDWISAIATNGAEGYIDADDNWVPVPMSPADAIANFLEQRTRRIPVYAEPGGGEVVGYFEIRYGGSGDTVEVPTEDGYQTMKFDSPDEVIAYLDEWDATHKAD